MKNLAHLIPGVLLVSLVLVLAAKTATAQDPAQVASQSYRVLFENDRVRVLDYHSQAGDKAAMHSHPDLVAYAFGSGHKVKFIFPDGKTAEPPESNAGTVVWVDAMTHVVENVGSTDAHFLLIELKR